MHRLYLVRHAEASHPKAGGADFDRPLSERGKRDAAMLGITMRTEGFRPAFVLCSSALRARQTWEGVARGFAAPFPETTYLSELYRGDAADYQILIATAPVADSLLVVGHNPMVQELAFSLPRSGEAQARTAVGRGFPAGALAVIDFAEPLWRIASGKGILATFLSPSDML
ncbi:histidine phosphatase family protein [Chelativorans sp. AA-79]|uniref:SixA phosphatase family protein n=1 Tax=Chelativorans sp. AA-79 TaxID=3028735 RepID=UPI0023FA1A29|nr:histidine phosphatase family protein [Chelativorans sp. AA-79]WEX07418.1 histidine phosphatase family protein [Chelativorans sp. AA-79]